MTDDRSTEERTTELHSHGWQRRFTASEPRLSEMTELYRSLGFEVLIEQPMPVEGQECRGCFDVAGLENRSKTIFTRKKPERH